MRTIRDEAPSHRSLGGEKLVDLELHRHFATDKAIRVSKHGEDSSAKWLPLSQIEVEPASGGRVLVTMPEWLAQDKGLI